MGAYTVQGQLVGHVVLGWELVKEAARDQPGFPPHLLQQLEHIILSHQGERAAGSPQPPKFPEALLVHLIDSMDGRLDLMYRALEDDRDQEPFTDSRNQFRTPLWKHHRTPGDPDPSGT